eukprot:5135770-Alexandrium_andersonii.AAC.1
MPHAALARCQIALRCTSTSSKHWPANILPGACDTDGQGLGRVEGAGGCAAREGGCSQGREVEQALRQVMCHRFMRNSRESPLDSDSLMADFMGLLDQV